MPKWKNTQELYNAEFNLLALCIPQIHSDPHA